MRHIRESFICNGLAVLIGLGLLTLAPHVYATSCATNPDQQSCSSGFGVSETFFGSGGVDTCPTVGGNQYCAKQSAGELTVGNTKGGQFQAQAGFNTDRTEWIELSLTKSTVDLGVVQTNTTGSDYASFTVKSYLSSGYVVQVVGAAPTYGTHAITALGSPTASNQGTEQFGMNLRDNSTPNVGVEPVQDPDSTFSFGTYASGYDVANSYKYASGDTIAESTKSSGYTNYTISYIMNISGVTPAGTYTTAQSLVATATF